MRKSALLISALAFSSIFGGLVASSAAPRNCTPADASESTKQRTGSDAFGSCETSDGNVKCGRDGANELGSGENSLGWLIVDQNKGVQACSEDGQDLPISGRITVYKHSGNKVTVGADGGDEKNAAFGGASGWDRLDVDADNAEVCFWRGSGGTYWQKNGAHGTVGGATGEFNECHPE
jgi:hypothetical protein